MVVVGINGFLCNQVAPSNPSEDQLVVHDPNQDENSEDGSPCIRSTVAELTYHTDTDHCQSGRLSDRHASMLCPALHPVCLSPGAETLPRFYIRFSVGSAPMPGCLSGVFAADLSYPVQKVAMIRHQALGDY